IARVEHSLIEEVVCRERLLRPGAARLRNLSLAGGPGGCANRGHCPGHLPEDCLGVAHQCDTARVVAARAGDVGVDLEDPDRPTASGGSEAEGVRSVRACADEQNTVTVPDPLVP